MQFILGEVQDILQKIEGRFNGFRHYLGSRYFNSEIKYRTNIHNVNIPERFHTHIMKSKTFWGKVLGMKALSSSLLLLLQTVQVRFIFQLTVGRSVSRYFSQYVHLGKERLLGFITRSYTLGLNSAVIIVVGRPV